MEDIYKALLDKAKQGHKCVMLTYLDLHTAGQGEITEKLILTSEDIERKSFPYKELLQKEIRLSLDNGKLQLVTLNLDKAVLIEPFSPKPRLIVFGGGHIAKPLAEFAARVGFSVTVIDDRPFFANNQRFPEAEEVICEDFKKSFDLISLRKSDYVVIITRGHRHDGIVLREVLKYDLDYIGMIGSKRRVGIMWEELQNEGFAEDKLDFVAAPIGLDIGAVTPEEIAISIVSQLICYKNKGIIDKYGKGYVSPEFDLEVLEKASEKSAIPNALITILSSKGSVPRKAGAKMVAYYDGRTIGSIGGGCSEAGVISRAREIMLDKGFIIEHIDLTGEAAEFEGMVCGGAMEVLIETL